MSYLNRDLPPMVARLEKTLRSVMFSGQDWMFREPYGLKRKAHQITINHPHYSWTKLHLKAPNAMANTEVTLYHRWMIPRSECSHRVIVCCLRMKEKTISYSLWKLEVTVMESMSLEYRHKSACIKCAYFVEHARSILSPFHSTLYFFPRCQQ